MLTSEERAEKIAGLQSMMVRGSLSDKIIISRREEIAKIFHPLPPPWEWERLRVLTGLTASTMEKRTGTAFMRIRHWEKGGGTAQPQAWVNYAIGLAQVVLEELGEKGADSASVSDADRVENASVRSLVEQQRVTVSALNVWLDQGIDCSPADMSALWESVRLTMKRLRRSDVKLRNRVLEMHAAQMAAQIGRNERNGTT